MTQKHLKGNRRLRSSVCFTENERLVGDFADASVSFFFLSVLLFLLELTIHD